MKKTALILSAMMLAAPLPVYAMDENEAREAASQYVPEGFEFKEAERDGSKWEVEFLSPDAEFEVTLSAEGTIREADYELRRKPLSAGFTLSKDDVKAIIRERFEGAKNITVRKKTSRKKGSYYKVKFRTAAYRGEAEISADTGTVWEYELKYTKKKGRSKMI